MRPPPRPSAVSPLAGLDEIELRIEKLVTGGDGLGRHDGVPIFVPRSAPGDLLRVQLVERRADFGRAEIVEILEPGAGRRTPPCPHFAHCGGCDLQHLEEGTQLRAKAEATLETLRRISGLALPTPRRMISGSPWGYRIRTQLHLEATGEAVAVGYRARGTRRLVPISSCRVLEPQLELAALALAARLRPPAPVRLDLAVGDDGRVVAAPPVDGISGGELSRQVGECTFHFDARTFFQGHAGCLADLVDEVVGDASGDTAFDLYAGVGLFSLPLARRYRRVVAVEGDRIASRYAVKNARIARLDQVESVAQAVESWVGSGLPDATDRVVVDPPRDGLPLVVRRLLAARPAARLTYVSCHAAALARDLRDLVVGYDVESIALADLFPQTGQMETIVQLTRKEPT